MKQKAVKKTPADYPQMIFRVGHSDKERIQQLVEKVTSLANRTALNRVKKFRKKDVIVDALFLGLLTLEKRLSIKKKKQ